MKTYSFLFVLLLVSTLVHAQDHELTGKWFITDFSITQRFVPDSLAPDSFVTRIDHQDADALASDSAVWTLQLSASGDLIQESNMRSGELERWNGNWEATDSTLILDLQVAEQRIVIIYGLEIKGEQMFLSRGNPMKTMFINTVFKRE